MPMDVMQNIRLFQELIRCGDNIYTWCYAADGALLHSNCPDEGVLNTAFDLFGCRQRMIEHGRKNRLPVSLGSAVGLIWFAAFEKEGDELLRCWVIGPVFYHDVSMRAVEAGFQQYGGLEISVGWKARFLKVLHTIPAVQSTLTTRYAVMLHRCLTGESIHPSDLDAQTELPMPAEAQRGRRDRHRVWMAEQALLQMVRTGDLNYKQALSNSMAVSAGVPVDSPDALRQGKVSVIVFASIVCRAAIEGGLSPEEAYGLGDQYIQTAESAKTMDDLTPLAPMLYDDFIRRVHRCRTNPKLSPQIQRCCDYIEMHLEQKIRASDLAVLVGYTEYYLTHKFKDEVGESVNDYVKFAKVERAKILLKSTDLTVQDIADQMGFGTRNYFSRVFQEVAGCTPIQYREERSLH